MLAIRPLAYPSRQNWLICMQHALQADFLLLKKGEPHYGKGSDDSNWLYGP